MAMTGIETPTVRPAGPDPAHPDPVRATGRDLNGAAARLLPRRRPGQWISALAALVLVAMAVHTLLVNKNFQWPVVWKYFGTKDVLKGLVLTIGLTIAVMVCGYVLGIGVAAMRLSSNHVLRTFAFGYVWLIRSVPPLVQLLFWYELASLYPKLSLGIPFGPEFVTFQTAHLFTGILAAFVGLTLDVAAFSSEIIRGGILAVEQGQSEAAQALGMSSVRIFRKIVLPQAMPAIIPASGNMLIGMLKATSIVSVIAVQDLLYSVQLIYNQNYLIIPLLLVATIWYIILTTVLSVGQFYVERHYSRGSRRGPDRGLWQITRGNLPIFGRLNTSLPGLS